MSKTSNLFYGHLKKKKKKVSTLNEKDQFKAQECSLWKQPSI